MHSPNRSDLSDSYSDRFGIRTMNFTLGTKKRTTHVQKQNKIDFLLQIPPLFCLTMTGSSPASRRCHCANCSRGVLHLFKFVGDPIETVSIPLDPLLYGLLEVSVGYLSKIHMM